MNSHTTDTELRDYVSGALPPAELIALDDHLGECEDCRTRAMRLRDPGEQLAHLRSELFSPDAHLSEEGVQQYVSGDLPGPSRASAEAHLRDCVMCAGEVDDLRAFARENAPRTRSWYYAAAAAAALIVVIAAGLLWRAPGPTPVNGSLAGLESLPVSYQQRVRAALDAGVAQPPEILAEMGGGPESLMGGTGAARFRLTAPLRTVTVSDRPTFRWEPLEGAGQSIVEVFDSKGGVVARSPAVTGAEWTPTVALPRGRNYVWQVTAGVGKNAVTEPAPPAPLATFRVLDGDTAALLARTESERPESHLLLGVLYAQAGVREEAERHLSKVSPSDPHVAVARASLDRLRRSTSTPR